MCKKTRRSFGAKEQVTIQRVSVPERRLTSEVSEVYQLQPALFYAWRCQLCVNDAAAFEKGNPTDPPRSACSSTR